MRQEVLSTNVIMLQGTENFTVTQSGVILGYTENFVLL